MCELQYLQKEPKYLTDIKLTPERIVMQINGNKISHQLTRDGRSAAVIKYFLFFYEV